MNPTSTGRDENLERVRQLDRSALTKIHNQYYPEVYRYVFYRLGEEQVAQDIAGEVFLRLLDSFHRNKGPRETLRGWLLGTASNIVNDYLRGKYARPLENLDDLEVPDHRSPEHILEAAWQLEQVREAIRRLTPDQQHVLAMRFANEFSLDETARLMKKSVNAVKVLQFRAIASLRRLLEEKS